MTNQERKIGRMQTEFGTNAKHDCGSCDNCIIIEGHDRNYTKCVIYGVTQSSATDWVQKWTACGMYNKSWTGPKMMNVFNSRRSKSDVQCDGQMKLF